MLFLLSIGEPRPSVLESNKDEMYHLKWARYACGEANNTLHAKFIENTLRNKRFYKNDQWFFPEDLEGFLKDDENQDRNRIKITQNIIRPMVEQYRGNAIRMQMNAKVKSVSSMAINRREKKLAEMLFFTDVAQKAPELGEDMKKKMAIGDTEAETKAIFENLYVDKYVEKMNYLLQYLSEFNKFQRKQVSLAAELALSGIGVMKGFEYSGNLIFKIIRSEDFFWDTTAKEMDFSDGEFWGDIDYLSAPEIFETSPDLTEENRKAIDSFARIFQKTDTNYNNISPASASQVLWGSGRIPVFNVYWRDSEVYEYAYVNDPYGYPYFTRINFVYDGEDKPRYTDADIITVDTDRSRRILKGKKKRKMFSDVMRFCRFIPAEILASMSKEDKRERDIVLEFGKVPYQETNSIDFNSVKSPYKCCSWGYIDGEVFSPVDDAINPQRFINRILSVAENQINNSRGSGVFYDKSFIDPKDGEDGILRNMSQSKPVGLMAKGRGMQNAVVSYDSTISRGTMVLFNIVDAMKNYSKETTGVNDALTGESTGSEQLVGVTQLLIQRGSLMQEPFYNAISEIYLQCFDMIATVGKKIYADNAREMAIAVGDEGVEVFQISKDMKMEDFRCFVKRENTDETLISSANSMLMVMLGQGMITQEDFANLFGRATPEMVAQTMRKRAKENIEIQRMAEKQGQQQQQQMMAMAQEETDKMEQKEMEMIALEDSKYQMDQKHDIDKIYAKSLSKMAENRDKTKAETKKDLIDNDTNLVLGL
jgi:hypothetical protein